MNEIRSLIVLRGVAALWVSGFHLWPLDYDLPAPAYAGRPTAGAMLRDLAALGIVLVLSAIAYWLVEEPGRRLPSRLGLLAPRPAPA